MGGFSHEAFAFAPTKTLFDVRKKRLNVWLAVHAGYMSCLRSHLSIVSVARRSFNRTGRQLHTHTHSSAVINTEVCVCSVSEMADRKSSSSGGVSSRLTVRKKDRAENEAKKEEKTPKEGEKAEVNGTNEPVENGASANGENTEKPELMELPPFEIITG